MIATTKQQAQRLIELGLPVDTADCVWIEEGDGEYRLGILNNVDALAEDEIPSWSFDVLWKQIPKELYPVLMTGSTNGKCYIRINLTERNTHPCEYTNYCDCSVTAVYEMVCWLLENNLIKTKEK